MKRILTSTRIKAERAESYLTESVKDDYALDLAKYHPGKYDQQGIGYLASLYGFNLVEMLDVLYRAVELDYAKCNKVGVSYTVYLYEG